MVLEIVANAGDQFNDRTGVVHNSRQNTSSLLRVPVSSSNVPQS